MGIKKTRSFKSGAHACYSGLHIKTAALTVAACFSSGVVLANPNGATVVHGSAQITTPATGVLNVKTFTPQTIINWNSFSIGLNELTRFQQPSATSAILNRVTGGNPSAILGALQSNGHVYLINPSGILFGAGSVIDVAGLVATSLNLSNADFLANQLKFGEVHGAGSIINQGNITTGTSGNVYLVGPAVTNSGLITSPKGDVILAAGNSVELVNSGTPNLRVEITAPDNQAVNLGRIVVDAGRLGIYAGLINHSGTLSADSAVITENGSILLKATTNIALEGGSVISASGGTTSAVALAAESGSVIAHSANVNTGSGGLSVVSGSDISLADSSFISTGAVTASGRDLTLTSTTAQTELRGNGVNVSMSRDITLRAAGFPSAFIRADSGTFNLSAGRDILLDSIAGRTALHSQSGLQTIDAGHGIVMRSGSSGLFNDSYIYSGAGQVITAGSGGLEISGGIGQGQAHIEQNSNSHDQFITLNSGGGLRVLGGAGFGTSATITNAGRRQRIVVEGGAVEVHGGSNEFASANIDNSGIFDGSQEIIFTAPGGSLSVIGGTGARSSTARISTNGGVQSIGGLNGEPEAPVVLVQGGASGGITGSGNSALITRGSGTINISAKELTLVGGGGVEASALISAPSISIDVAGQTALRGGTGSGAVAGIGTSTAASNVTLQTRGNLTLTGGSGLGSRAMIGSRGRFDANMVLYSGGSIQLQGGVGLDADAVIGADIEKQFVLVTSGLGGSGGTLPPPPNTNLTISGVGISMDSGVRALARIGSNAGGGMISLASSNGMTLGSGIVSSIHDVSLWLTGGSLSQSTGGNIKTSLLNVMVSGGGDVKLTGQQNQEIRALNVITDGGNLDVNSMSLNSASIKVGNGNVGITTLLGVNFGSLQADSLLVTTTGNIQQTGPITVRKATFSSHEIRDISLAHPSNDFGLVSITNARNVRLHDKNDIVLDSITLTGTLNITAGGIIFQKNDLATILPRTKTIFLDDIALNSLRAIDTYFSQMGRGVDALNFLNMNGSSLMSFRPNTLDIELRRR